MSAYQIFQKKSSSKDFLLQSLGSPADFKSLYLINRYTESTLTVEGINES